MIAGVPLWVVSGFVATAHGQAQPVPDEPEVRTVARLVATSGVAGNLARPRCGEDTTVRETPFAHLTPRLVAHSQQAKPPLILDTGGLLHPGGFARFAARSDPEGLADLVAGLGYRVLVFGPSDLRAPRTSQLAVYGALRDRGVSVVATNLYCDPEAQDLCDVLVDGRDGVPLFHIGQRRIGVVGVMPEETLDRVAADLAQGLNIAPMAEYLARAVVRARASGADLVVAVTHAAEVGEAVTLASELPPDQRPDLLLSANGGEELLFARPRDFHPAIVAAPPEGAVVTRIRESLDLGTYDVLTRPMIPSRWTAAVFEEWVAAMGMHYCEQWGRRLPGGGVDARVTGREMIDLAAGVMREVADAEIAVLNEGALDDRWSAMEPDSITASDVFIAFPYDEPLVVGDVDAAWLEELRKSSGLVTLGLAEDAVNGRPLESQGLYRVVTLRFLAEGGDGALPPGPEWQSLGDTRLREAVLSYLEEPREIDPREGFTDPTDDFVWVFRWDLNASFSGVAVDNPEEGGEALYSATQLTRDDTISLGVDTTVRADALSRVWRWDNELRVRTLRTRSVGTGFSSDPGVIALRSTVTYRGLQRDSSRFYIPEPFLETFVESEVSIPEERNFRHFELRPTLGLRFSLADELSLSLGASFRTELLDPDREVLPGSQAELRLAPWVIVETGVRRLTLEGFLTFFATGSLQELRGQVDSGFDILGPLALLFRFGLFGQQDGGQPVGLAFDTSVALRLRLVGRVAP